ncbi:MAG TPA: YcxB family protein [Candidatus Eisenbergiella merdavium]|uniref:YcxB family protein n=1 Tax=Candidatus Eisenbergiella merdavium TaxID=2838551 RepID=A0A9D2NGD5_9FIRM|nr:YcxB family protein [Candidatus Eisenbergiella merdavium]
MQEKELEMAEAGEITVHGEESLTEGVLTEEAVQELPEAETEAGEEGSESDSRETGEAGTENEEAPDPSLTPYAGSGRKIRISGPLLYENSFTITEELYQEFLKASMGRYRKLYYIVGGVSLALGLFSFLGGAGPSALLFFVITALCIFLPANTYRSAKKKKYAQQVAQNGGKPLERRVMFYMSGLEIYSNSGAHSVFRYGDITKIIHSKSMYLLVIKKMSLLVLKDSFTKGTLEEWKTFMNKKGLWKVK